MRRLRHWAVGSLLAAGVALVGLGCAGPAAPTSPADQGDASPGATTPPPRLVVAFKQLIQETTSTRQTCCFDIFSFYPAHEALIQGDPKSGAPTQPYLATEWRLDETANTIHFKLRQGVQFHRGFGEMKATDVAATFQNMVTIDQPPGHAWVANWWRPNIKAVEAKSDYEVDVVMTRPHALVWFFISDVFQMLPVQSKADFDQRGEPKSLTEPWLASTGPYQFKERKPSQSLVFERVPYKHWRVTPDFQELEMRWINEPSTRAAALLAGEVHLTDLPADLQKETTAKGMKLIASPPVVAVFLNFRCCHADPQTRQWPMYPESPLLNIKVREALNRAIDRDELARAFSPKYETMYATHFRPERIAWDPRFQQQYRDRFGYDPEKARRLLAEAGYTPQRPAEITMPVVNVSYLANGPDIVEALAQRFRAVGFKVNLLQIDAATETAQYRAGQFSNHVRLQNSNSNVLDGTFIFNLANSLPGTGYFTPELLAMRDELNAMLDPAKQEAMLRKIGNWGYDNYWDVPLFWKSLEVMVNPRVVADWPLPGTWNAGWSHFEYIKAAR